MKAEYFPPKEDVILQNEAPTDFYVVVTGEVDIIKKNGGVEQFHLNGSLEELLEIGAQKFRFNPTKVFLEGGAFVDDISLIRDGDHLILTNDQGFVKALEGIKFILEHV